MLAGMRSLWRSLLAGLVLGACTDPQFSDPDDAGEDDAADGSEPGDGDDVPEDAGPAQLDADTTAQTDASDGGVEPPGWAAKLLGTYATRTYYFAQDDFGLHSRAKEIALVDIRERDGMVVLTSQLCSMSGDNDQGTATLRMEAPSAQPARVQHVHYDEATGQFHTTAVPVTVGYEPEVPPMCVGKEGEEVPKGAQQDWLASTCKCPLSSASLPTLEDCRVGDPEDDSAAGFTMELKGTVEGLPGFFDAKLHVASRVESHMVLGDIAVDGRHTAKEEHRETGYQLSCVPSGCAEILSISTWCPADFNRVEFEPLAGRPLPVSGVWSCSAVVAIEDSLFDPHTVPDYPTPSCL